MHYTHLPKRTAGHLTSLYKSEEEIGAESLQKAEEFDISKGRKGLPIGSKKMWGGKEYIKTSGGWTPSKKAKEAHEVIHGSGDDKFKYKTEGGKEWDLRNDPNHEKHKETFDTLTSKDHEELSKLHRKMESDTTTASQQGFHAGMRDLHQKKSGKNKAGFNSGDDHGIEVGKVYNHDTYGHVKVTKVEKNEGDKKDSISHHVSFKTRGGAGIEETQGINGFRHGTTGDYNGKPKPVEEESAEKKKHGEELKAGDKVVVHPNHPVQFNGKVKEAYGNNGVKVEDENGRYAVHDRNDVKSEAKHKDDLDKMSAEDHQKLANEYANKAQKFNFDGDRETANKFWDKAKEHNFHAFGKDKEKFNAVLNNPDVNVLKISNKNPLSTQLSKLTGDHYNAIDFDGDAKLGSVLTHKATGKKFTVIHENEAGLMDHYKNKHSAGSDIPEKVREKFKEVKGDNNFSFMNMQGRIWRRDNKTGEITNHTESPKFVLPK